jgi:hypothetical protein
MKRRRTIPRALSRLRFLRGSDSARAPSSRRFARAVRRVREAFLGVMPGAQEIDAANDSEQ